MTNELTHLAPWNKNLQIAWDATSLRVLMKCPREYEYAILRGYRGLHTNLAILFGLAYHEAREIFDRKYAETGDVDASLIPALEYAWEVSESWIPKFGEKPDLEVWAAHLGKPDNARTRRTLCRALIWSVEALGTDILVPVKLPDGSLAIELSWRVPLPIEYLDYAKLAKINMEIEKTGNPEAGYEKYGNQYSSYLLCGHFDGLATFGEDTYVLERKTTKNTVTSHFFKRYAPDPQISTYALAADLMYQTLDIRGVIVEVMQTAVSFSRFLRQPIKRTESQREEWLEHIIHYIRRAETYAEDGFFPMNEAVCTMYGGCQFQKICAMSPMVRDDFLESNFRVEHWNPLRIRETP